MANFLSVRRITPDQYLLHRQVRLEALRESPSAFGTTFVSASERTDDEWKQMTVLRSSGNRSALFLLYDSAENAVGIVGGYCETDTDTTAELTSLWVASGARGQGGAQLLVQAILDWAEAIPVTKVTLDVDLRNQRVLSFYQRLGFIPFVQEAHQCPSTTDDITLVRYFSSKAG